jgi:hypothetical protein
MLVRENPLVGCVGKLPKGHGDATSSVTNFSSVNDVIPSQRADAVHPISCARIALDVKWNLHIYIFQIDLSRKKVTLTQILLTLFNFLHEIFFNSKIYNMLHGQSPTGAYVTGVNKAGPITLFVQDFQTGKQWRFKSATRYIRTTYFLCPLKSTLYLVTRLVKCWRKGLIRRDFD